MFSKRMIQNTEKQQNTDQIVVTQKCFESSLKLRKAPAHLIPGFHKQVGSIEIFVFCEKGIQLTRIRHKLEYTKIYSSVVKEVLCTTLL